MKINPLIFLFIFWALQLCQAAVETFPWPLTIPKSNLYEIKILSKNLNVFPHLSKPNLTKGPDGNGVTNILNDRTMTYGIFNFDESIEIEVTKKFGSTAQSIEILPGRYQINPHYFDGKTVRFILPPPQDLAGPAYISINYITNDNQDDDGTGGKNILNGLMLFGDLPIGQVIDPNAPDVTTYKKGINFSNANTIYFPPGDYDLKNDFPQGILPFKKNGQKVFLAGGAYIRGTFHGNGYDNLEISGRGIISGMDYYWHEIVDNSGKKTAFLNFMGTDNSLFSGIVINHPCHHTWPSSKANHYKQIKLIGWASNHDGIRPSDGSIGEELFIKTSDDLDYARDNHIVKNSVIWPMRNGAFGQLGWNNLGQGLTKYKNLFFINTEWIDNQAKRNTGIIGSVLQQGVQLKNDTLENLYCDGFMSMLANMTIEFEPKDPWDPSNPGIVSDFLFKNIFIEKFKAPNGNIVKNPIRGFVKDGKKAMIKNIRFVNIIAGNELITQSNFAKYFEIDPLTTSNISFETEGIFHTVSTKPNPDGSFSPSGNIPTPQGTDRIVQIKPNPGYKLVDVLVNGISQGRLQTVVLRNVAKDFEIEAIFETGNDFFDLPPQLSSSTSSSSDLSSSSTTQISYPNINNLSASQSNCQSVHLSWEGQEYAEAYRIRRKAESENIYSNIADLPASSTEFIDTQINQLTNYSYMVRPLVDNTAVALSNITTIQTFACTSSSSEQTSSSSSWSSSSTPSSSIESSSSFLSSSSEQITLILNPKVDPNPFQWSAQVYLDIKDSKWIGKQAQFTVYDASGKMVREFWNHYLNLGYVNTYLQDGHSLKPGIYTIRVKINNALVGSSTFVKQ